MYRLDMLGKEIKIGDRVVYGKSNRDNPISLGVVKDIVDYDDYSEIAILGDGNKKVGYISNYLNFEKRIVVLQNKV